MTNKEELEKFIGNLVSQTLKQKGLVSSTPKKKINESLVATPSSFIIKTDKLSKKTVQNHEIIYKKHLEAFNKVSSELDAVNTHESNSYASAYRSLKLEECSNLNAVKLHELYFNNISDMASQIGLDSVPYMKLSRDFGTFERWQFDFIACAMAADEGWAMTVYEPYKNVYMNVCVNANTGYVPVGCIPVMVIDMWTHAFFLDFGIDKKAYVSAMMKELNWDVVEARMVLAEKSELSALYKIKPIYNDNPDKILNNAYENAPITQISTDNGSLVSPTTLPEPEKPRGF